MSQKLKTIEDKWGLADVLAHFPGIDVSEENAAAEAYERACSTLYGMAKEMQDGPSKKHVQTILVALEKLIKEKLPQANSMAISSLGWEALCLIADDNNKEKKDD